MDEMAYLKEQILQDARGMGIEAAGVAPFDGEGFRSCLVLLFPYFAGFQPGGIAKYARGEDYHRVIHRYLRRLEKRVRALSPGALCRAGVDNHPLNERFLAWQAGLGVIGRNQNLIHSKYGSFVFIATLLLSLPLPPDRPRLDSCQNCGRCLRACPASALPCPASALPCPASALPCPTGEVRMENRTSCPAGALTGLADEASCPANASDFAGKSDAHIPSERKDTFVLERCLSHLSQKKRLTPEEESLLSRGPYCWGCDVCQDVCPHNQNLPITPFVEFKDNLMFDFDEIEQENFRKKYGDRAFSWRGFHVIERNRRIFRAKTGKDNSAKQDADCSVF